MYYCMTSISFTLVAVLVGIFEGALEFIVCREFLARVNFRAKYIIKNSLRVFGTAWSELQLQTQKRIYDAFTSLRRASVFICGVSFLSKSSSSSSCGSAAQFGPWPPLLGFRNSNLFTGLDC
jgi:hypothetical protein